MIKIGQVLILIALFALKAAADPSSSGDKTVLAMTLGSSHFYEDATGIFWRINLAMLDPKEIKGKLYSFNVRSSHARSILT